MSIPGAYPHDVTRARDILARQSGFAILAGRGIVNVQGAVVAHSDCRRLVRPDGRVVDSHDPPALTPCDADSMAHAVAYALNMASGRQYTLAELRNGTGFPRGARFVMVSP